MAKLMTEAKKPSKTEVATRIGGLPMAPAGTEWPRCKTCKGPMQFFAQILLPDAEVAGLKKRDQLLLLFQCQNDPGMCDEWDANLEGNAAMLVSTSEAVPMTPPKLPKKRGEHVQGAIVLGAVHPIKFSEYTERAKKSDDDPYIDAYNSNRAVVGKLGGRPSWIQADETPKCKCRAPMKFVAQVEERADPRINFGGGGVGYAFVCGKCKDKAKFLWQR